MNYNTLSIILLSLVIGSVSWGQTPIPDPLTHGEVVLEGPITDALAKRIDTLISKLEARHQEDRIELTRFQDWIKSKDAAELARQRGLLSKLEELRSENATLFPRLAELRESISASEKKWTPIKNVVERVEDLVRSLIKLLVALIILIIAAIIFISIVASIGYNLYKKLPIIGA